MSRQAARLERSYPRPTLCKCCPISRRTSFWLLVNIFEKLPLPLLNGNDELLSIVCVDVDIERLRAPLDAAAAVSCPLLLAVLVLAAVDVMVVDGKPLM